MLNGIAASPGIGIGTVVRIRAGKAAGARPSAGRRGSADDELVRLAAAMDLAVSEIAALADKLEKQLGEDEAMILRAQEEILNDPLLAEQMEEKIESGESAEEAAAAALNAFAMMFAEVPNPQIRERVTDITDARNRLLAALVAGDLAGENAGTLPGDNPAGLSGGSGSAADPADGGMTDVTGMSDAFAQMPAGTVLVAEELTPSMTASLDKEKIAAIVTEKGGMTSHAAILARAMGIPAVLGAEGALDALEDGMEVTVNGEAGTVETADENAGTAGQSAGEVAGMSGNAAAANARDGGAVEQLDDGEGLPPVYCNIGSVEEARAAGQALGSGIGLLRTEFLFLGRGEAPSEEEQYEAYCEICGAMDGKPVIARLLDIGGDKQAPYLPMPAEDDPFLGLRGIRYLLQNQDIFAAQVRAIARANADCAGELKIMLPMIARISEDEEARRFIEEQAKSLGLAAPAIGVMIETPAACLCADELAAVSDFFSIGTNDLTQYILAAGRMNSSVADSYRTDDPAVLRAIRMAIDAAHEAGIPVGMCGEAAADEALVPVFAEMGLDAYSVTPLMVQKVRRMLRKIR